MIVPKAGLVHSFALFIAFSVTYGQSARLDSLHALLKEHAKADSTKVELLHSVALELPISATDKAMALTDSAARLSAMLKFGMGKARNEFVRAKLFGKKRQYDSALVHFEEALVLYKTLESENQMAQCYTNMGIMHYYLNTYQEALKSLKRAYWLHKKHGNTIMVAASLNSLATTYSELGNYVEAVENYENAIEAYKEVGNRKGMAKCYNNLGVAYDDQGNFPLALEYYHKALEMARRVEDNPRIYRSLNNIGIIYKRQERYKEALSNYSEALELCRDLGNKEDMALVLNNIGIISKHLNDYKKAIARFEEGVAIAMEIGDKKAISKSYNNLGDTYLITQEYGLALNYFKKALVIKKDIKDLKGTCSSLSGLSEVLLTTKNYKEALYHALNAESIASKHGFFDEQRHIFKQLHTIYAAQGDYQRAYRYHQAFKAINDSLVNKKSIQKMTRLEYEYRHKQELESANLRERKLTQEVESTYSDLKQTERNSLIAIIAFLVVIIVLSTLILSLKLKNAQTEIRTIQIEQKLLRSQMTPHFIFNSLSVMHGMILEEEPQKAISYVTKFSKLLRIVLENSRDKLVLLREELKAVANYLQLRQLEPEIPYTFEITIDSNTRPNNFLVPPMLIQPFVENALEHAFENEQKHKKIEVDLKFIGDQLICTIKDNGRGVDALEGRGKRSKRSLATIISLERMKILSKDLDTIGDIAIEDLKKYNEKGTLVTLTIPYKKEMT